MSAAVNQIAFESVGITITGASHVGSNTPRQDFIWCWPQGSELASFITMCLSDGHSSRLHALSGIGSRLVTEIAVNILSETVWKLSNIQVNERLLTAVMHKAAKDICDEWNKRVIHHSECERLPHRLLNPLTDSERQILKSSPQVAYGATFLSVSVTERFALMLRLGDGVIACCSDSGTVTLPFDEQEKQSQKTDSLCSENAYQRVKVEFLDFKSDDPPAFFVLATDGYPDAVGGVKPFLDHIRTFSQMLRKEGLEGFSQTLKTHLTEDADKLYDDTTLGLLVRSDWLKKQSEPQQ